MEKACTIHYGTHGQWKGWIWSPCGDNVTENPAFPPQHWSLSISRRCETTSCSSRSHQHREAREDQTEPAGSLRCYQVAHGNALPCSPHCGVRIGLTEVNNSVIHTYYALHRFIITTMAKIGMCCTHNYIHLCISLSFPLSFLTTLRFPSPSLQSLPLYC